MCSKTLCCKVFDRKKQAGREKKRRPQTDNKCIYNNENSERNSSERWRRERVTVILRVDHRTCELLLPLLPWRHIAHFLNSATDLQETHTERKWKMDCFQKPTNLHYLWHDGGSCCAMPWTPKPTFWGTYWPKSPARKQKRKGQRTALPESFR